MPKQIAEQLKRGVVCPLEVVQDDDHRPPRRHVHQERADCPVSPETLVLKPTRWRRAGARRREHPAQFVQTVADELLEPIAAECRGMVIERIHPDAEGQRTLELRAAPAQHGVIPVPRAGRQLAQQPRLSRARLTTDRDPASRRRPQLVQRGDQGRQFVTASHE